MNKLESRFTTLKQSLKLKELGVEQELQNGDWFFLKGNNELSLKCSVTSFIYSNDFNHLSTGDNDENTYLGVKAFDGSQIDKMLPFAEGDYILRSETYGENGFKYFYYDKHGDNKYLDDLFGFGSTHIEAKTNLLINLLEQGLISIS